MTSEIIIREARPEDYSSFRRMEKIIWEGTGVDIIEEEMFLTWIDIFPEGFVLAMRDNEVLGQLYGQICNFNPYDKNDQRDLNTMTDDMWTKKTHNPSGNCCYTFSVTGLQAKAVKLLNEYYVGLTHKLNKQFYSGVVRMPGLDIYMKREGLKKLTLNNVSNYVKAVFDTVRRRRKGEEKIFDPVVTPILFISVKNAGEPWAIEKFFPFPGTQSWGCVLWYENIDYKNNQI